MSYLNVLLESSNWIWRETLNHMWQATLFFAIGLVTTMLLRRSSARGRYLIWLAVSLKFALPSAVIVFALGSVGIDLQSVLDRSHSSTNTLHYISPVVSPLVVPASYLSATEPEASAQPVPKQSRWLEQEWLLPMAGFVLWFSGATTFFLMWLRRRRDVSQTIKNGPLIREGREWEALQRVKAWLLISRRIGLLITPDVKEPGVWRVFVPVVLLPSAIASELSDEELEALMMHELGHVLRWDNLVSNFNMILCCIFWFTPIIWLIDRRLLKEREEVCDEMVLRWTGTGEVYATSLKKVYRLCLMTHVSGLSAAGGSKLKQRLERILDGGGERQFSFVHKTLIATVVFGCIALNAIGGMRPADSSDPDNVFVKAAERFRNQLADSKTADCLETDLKKCPHVKNSTIQATGALAQVVVQSEVPSPIETANNTTSDVNDRATTQPQNIPAAPRAEPASNFVSAHAINLERLAGRYAVDPHVMENFVLDISVADGQLFLKPSHARKRRLIAESPVEYVDAESPNTRITFDFDEIGMVENLILRGWGQIIVAPRLVLPPPSRDGNVVFKLSGFPTASIVAVAGTFNGWDQSQYLFERVGDEWICKIALPPGKWQYKFIVDGNWLLDPNNPTVVRDRRNFENSQLIVR
jgi:beta-lactamase regulating signal transducer with metallopeptidase domain